MRRHAKRAAPLLAGLLACAVAASERPAPPPASSDEQTLAISSDLQVRVLRGRDLELLVLAAESDGYPGVAARVGRGPGDAEALSAWNGGGKPAPGTWVRVPLALLSADYRALVLRTVFPNDGRSGEDWVHVARSGRLPTYDEGLWDVAEWFTGRGDSFQELMAANRLSSPELREGQKIVVPKALLLPAFHAGMRSERGELEYGADADGPYAGYRLKAGEALYSAVVGRFTGRTGADDVREVAELLRTRSGIRDLRDIPVDYLIKIPLDLLEPQFLPAGHPRRIEAEAAAEALAEALASDPVDRTRRGLEGVLVVLDPGHGGRDLGTMNNGIWEHDYVYDVACRLRKKLLEQTEAEVRLTLIDKKTGCKPSAGDKLVANRQGTIQTTPPFLAEKKGQAAMGVNLRWYLANSIYREARKNEVDADRVVFISLHADARHPSLSGVMVYVPGSAYRTRTYGSNSKSYRKYREVREKPHVRFSKKDRVRSEAVSQRFAESVVRAFREAGLPVQPYQPVRNRIIRGKSIWVPAVLRGNTIPNKVLVEMVNLTNKKDAALLSSARERDRLADALLHSLRLHFGEL